MAANTTDRLLKFIDHSIYIKTNEEGADTTLEKLKALPARGNTLVGVSATFNFDLITARPEIEYAYILDASPKVIAFMERLREIILSNPTREGFLAEVNKIEEMRPVHPRIGGLRVDWDDSTPFLATDETYERIYQMFQDDRIEIRQINLFHPDQVSELTSQMESRAQVIDTLYLSNVGEYAKRYKEMIGYDSEGGFAKTVELLSPSHPYTIDSDWHEPDTGRTVLKQRLTVPAND